MKDEKCCCCLEDNTKPIKVRFCPKCKSTDVGFVFRLQTLFGLLPKVECRKCGYQNIDFPIIVIKKKELEKMNKKEITKRQNNKIKKVKRKVKR
jgi:Zn ribbon nucleic-acid-binding protein